MHNEQQNDIAVIEQYLFNQMPADQAKEVEKRLANDPTFAELAQDMGMIWMASHQLKQKKQLFVNKTGDPQVKVVAIQQPKVLNWNYAAAAVIAVFLAATAIFWGVQHAYQVNTDELFTAYYAPHAESTSRNIENVDPSSSLSKGLKLYSEKKYEPALEMFDMALELAPNDERALFFWGITQIELGNRANALKHFQQYQPQFEFYQEEALWYMALLAIEANDLSTARGYLDRIHATPELLSKAKQLKEKIK